MRKCKKKTKRVILGLTLVLIVAGFLTGCVVADRNTRRIGFGDTTPVVSRYTGEGDRRGITVYLLGQRIVLDATPLIQAAQAAARGVESAMEAVRDVASSWAGQIRPSDW